MNYDDQENELKKIAVIGFDYVPAASPLDRGWKVSYGAKTQLDFSVAVDAPIAGSLSMVKVHRAATDCAIEYEVANSVNALCDRLKLAIKFSTEDDAMFWTEVELAKADNSKGTTVFIKHYKGNKPSEKYLPPYTDEWARWMSGRELGNGWTAFDIYLPEAVQETWGKENWIFKKLKSISIRGNISISPIELNQSIHKSKATVNPVILEISGVLIFIVVAVGMFDAGFHCLGYIFSALTVACGVGLIDHHNAKSGFKHRRKLFWALMILNLLLFGFLSWHTFLTERADALSPNKATLATTEAFSIIPREKYVEMNTPRYFLSWLPNQRRTLSPINVLMFAQFTNMRQDYMTINSYQFEGRTTNGQWEIMPTIDIASGHLTWFYGTNWGYNGFGITLKFEEGAALTAGFGDDVFPSILNGKTIGPHQTISGYFFLEGPKHGFDGAMRCRVIDSTDNEFVEIVKPTQATNYLKTFVQNGEGMTMGRESEDVSKAPIIRYSEVFGSH